MRLPINHTGKFMGKVFFMRNLLHSEGGRAQAGYRRTRIGTPTTRCPRMGRAHRQESVEPMTLRRWQCKGEEEMAPSPTHGTPQAAPRLWELPI